MKLKRTILYPSSILLGALLLGGSTLFNACKSGGKPGADNFKATGDTIADGKALVNLYCTKCHKLVEADQLTKDVWKFHALPSMSTYVGISNYGNVGYFKHNPDSAGISLVNWQTIVAYYNKVAPDSLKPGKPPVAATEDMAGFAVKKTEYKATNREVVTSFVAADTANNKIYTADALTSSLTEWDANLKPTVIGDVPSPVVSANFYKDAKGAPQGLFNCIGELQPIDFPNGKVISINLTDPKHTQTVVGSELSRPVQTIAGDFNKDGLSDWVILGEGNKRGAVYLMTQKSDHTYTQSTAIDKPGAVAAVAGDFNNDGWTDLMVLFGSSDEGLWLLLNDHKGSFTAKNLLRFPPVYGSTSFQLADMNHDGKLDVVYTCGYNFHDSRIMKPYHGVYVYLNQGDWNLKQSWFYPINGCTKVAVADFDHDGDLDIITSAFFADLQHNPAEQVMYFEQDKPMSFKAHSIPVSKYGRFLSMDVADYNHDGKPDVLLGNYSRGFVLQPDLKPFWDRQTPFIILQNNMGK